MNGQETVIVTAVNDTAFKDFILSEAFARAASGRSLKSAHETVYAGKEAQSVTRVRTSLDTFQNLCGESGMPPHVARLFDEARVAHEGWTKGFWRFFAPASLSRQTDPSKGTPEVQVIISSGPS